jgi:methylated-DNA-[protein]-cysteine S-methyltransferase
MKQERLTPSFTEKCYQLVARIPHGKVTTYKLIANALGSNAYRAVGTAMKNNPDAPKVPCHRVIATNGALGGYAYGAQKKAALLRAEGIVIKNGHICNLEQVLWQPSKHR